MDVRPSPESTPLLETAPDPKGIRASPSHIRVLVIYATFILLQNLAGFLQQTPELRILESIVCRNYYRQHRVVIGGLADSKLDEERQCKIGPVQAELATLRGWSQVFDLLPGALLSIPFGQLGDTHGRKFVLILSLVGTILGQIWTLIVYLFPEIFPVRLAWAAAAFQTIGGGPMVSTSMIFALIADVCTPEERTQTFARMSATVLVAEVISVPLGSLLMIHDVWLPMYMGTAAQLISSFMVALVPETNLIGPLGDEVVPDATSDSLSDESGRRDGRSSLLASLKSVLDDWAVLRSPRVIILSMTFFINKLARASFRYLLQYASSQFDWTLAKAGLLNSLMAGVNFIALVVLLPMASYLLVRKLSLDFYRRDLYLAHASIALLITGSIVMSLPSTALFLIGLVISSLGSGSYMIIRSVLTSVIAPDEVSRVYAVISVMETLGGIISGPIMAACYRLGLTLGGMWAALPFIASAFIFSFMAALLWIIPTVQRREG